MKVNLSILCLLFAAASAQHIAPARTTPHMMRRSTKHVPRQFLNNFLGTGDDSNTITDTSSSDNTPTSTSSTQQTSTSTTPTTSAAPTSTSITTPTSTIQSSSTKAASTSTSYRSTVTSSSQTQFTSSTTNAAGSVVFTTETVAPSSTSSQAVATASQTSAVTSSGSGSHTGLIIGVSVVGGVALLGALIFLWMKFGGKRFSDYQDEDSDIKWPELKTDGDSAAMQPLPARRTGGSGFDMGNEFDDNAEADGQSVAEYGNLGQSVAGSTTALNSGVGAGAGAASVAGYGKNGAYSTGMEGYHDESPSATNHYAQPVVAGYYDPYSSSAYPSAQPQTFYPEQGAPPYDGEIMAADHQSPQYEGDYNNYSTEPYAASTTSPHMAPYRANSQNYQRGY